MSREFKQIQRAKDIVARYRERGTIPREQRDRSDPAKCQEYRDACKIKIWKYALMGNEKYSCSNEVRDYLDENMPGWRERVYSHQGKSSSTQMRKAKEIVERYRERGCMRPRRNHDPARQQENKDATQLNTWRSAVRGQNQVTCSTDLRDYLDQNLPEWRYDHLGTTAKNTSYSQQLQGMTTDILNENEKHSSHCNGTMNPVSSNASEVNPLPAANITRQSLKGQSGGAGKMYEAVNRLYVHNSVTLTSKAINTPNNNNTRSSNNKSSWQKICEEEAKLHFNLTKARDIVQRCHERVAEGKHYLPRLTSTPPNDFVHILDQIYAEKLHSWKTALLTYGEEAGIPNGGIRWELKSYLDMELGDWLSVSDDTSSEDLPPNYLSSLSESGSSIDAQASESEQELNKNTLESAGCSMLFTSYEQEGTTSQSHSSSNTSLEEGQLRQQIHVTSDGQLKNFSLARTMDTKNSVGRVLPTSTRDIMLSQKESFSATQSFEAWQPAHFTYTIIDKEKSNTT